MRFSPQLGMKINGYEFNYKFFQTLKCVAKTWSQRKAAHKLGVSPAVLNRRILDAENKLGFKLLRSSGAGSELTEPANMILKKYQRYLNRVKEREYTIISGGHISSGLLEALALANDFKAVTFSSHDKNSFYLAEKNYADILTLDDPLIAFENDLDFTPIAYDHLVLISSPELQINSIKELEGEKFVAVNNSSQRLAWKTLENSKIDFKIYKTVNSPFEAFKIVNNSKNLHTFLNASFFKGKGFLKEETKHIISLINYAEADYRLKNFIEYILGPGQKVVKDQGFEPL